MEMIKYNNTMFGLATLECDAFEYENICKNEHCYEGIPSDKLIKLYGDIDYGGELDGDEEYDDSWTETFIDIAKESIETTISTLNSKIIPEYCVAIASSSCYTCNTKKVKKWKVSIHIIVTNIVSYQKNIKDFFNLCNQTAKDNKQNYYGDYVLNMKDLFDMSVYGNNQKFRSIYSSKVNEKRPLELVEGSFNDSIISACFGDDLYELNQIVPDPEPIVNETTIIKNSLLQKCEEDDYNFIEMCIDNNLFIQLATEYKTWLSMAYAIKNTLGDKGKILFHQFSKLSSKYDETETTELYNKIDQSLLPQTGKTEKKKLSIASIKKWAKDEKPTLYQNIVTELRKKNKQKKIIKNDDNITLDITDYTMMKEFYEYCQANEHYFYCLNIKTSEFIFLNKENIWEMDVNNKGVYIYNLLSQDFTKTKINLLIEWKVKFLELELDAGSLEYLEWGKKLKMLNTFITKLNTNANKQAIMNELKFQISKPDFTNNMNSQKGVIPLKNKLMCRLETIGILNIIETYPRTHLDKFNYMCNVEFMQFDNNIKEFQDIDNYFKSLFSNDTDTLQVFLDVIKTSIAGYRLKNLFLLTGAKGNNGKSTFFELLKNICGNCIDTISKKVIILNAGGSSHLNTELEKLPNIRVGYVCELTDGDTYNIPVIKQIIGGDPMNLRTLNKTDQTIYPSCNLFGLTNQNGNFNNDELFSKRIVIFPFENEFKNDNNFIPKMKALKDYLFNYIIEKGKIITDVVPSQNMVKDHQEYMTQNKIDYVEEFIDDCYDNDDNGKIVTNDVYTHFINWCSQRKYKNNINSQTKFTKTLKDKGYKCDVYNKKRHYYGLVEKTDEKSNGEDKYN